MKPCTCPAPGYILTCIAMLMHVVCYTVGIQDSRFSSYKDTCLKFQALLHLVDTVYNVLRKTELR